MFNPIDVYQDCGRKAAIATNQGDAARARFERDYFGRMLALELMGDRQAARQAYEAAYRSARVIGR